jgi:hypothetical protein
MRQSLVLITLVVATACSTSTSPDGPPGPTAAVTSPAQTNRGTLGVSPATALFVPGQTASFVAVAEQIFTANLADVVWSVDDPAVATVSSDGRLTAVAPGFTWLRAIGTDGMALHPISVGANAPIDASGDYQISGCGSPNIMTCSAAMKAGGSRAPVSLRYRTAGDLVVSEFWMGNDRSRAALVGRREADGSFRFGEPAPLTPTVSAGAGGCCSRLREFVALVSDSRVLSGEFAAVTTDATYRYRLLPR